MIFCQIFSIKSLSKCTEISLKNLNVLDIWAKRVKNQSLPWIKIIKRVFLHVYFISCHNIDPLKGGNCATISSHRRR